MNEENMDIIPSIDGIPIPEKVKSNAIIALAKGVGNLITNIIDIPNAYIERFSQGIRTGTAVQSAIQKATAESACDEIRKNSALQERAVVHFAGRMLLEQNNREKVALKTLENLRNTSETPSGEEIDIDWLEIFWRIAETKSNEEIQHFLSKLLEKEIHNPGNISPHTLQVLSILTSSTANKFQNLANLSIFDGKNAFVIHPHVFPFQNIGPLEQYGVQYDDLFELDGVGLLRSAETLTLNYKEDPEGKFEEVNYAGTPIHIRFDGMQVRLIQFTKPGMELRGLIDLKKNDKYTQTLQEQFKEKIKL